MSTTIETALTDRVAAILAEITATEAARVPIDQEVQAELARLEALAARADAASPGAWLSPNSAFSPTTFSDSTLAALLLIEPDKVRQVITAYAKRRGEAWKGLRMGEPEKQRRLTKLQQDLRIARARLEQRRRDIEQQTGDALPRINDDPSIWLLPPAQLAELAGTSNGRSK